MNRFIVVPNEFVGPVIFGTERDQVRRVLNGFNGEFRKSKFSKTTTDDFGYCHVYYDEHDRCNAVEFFEGCELIYDGKDLFALGISDLEALFSDIKEEYGSWISESASIGIVFVDERAESILVGRKNYYR